LFFYDLRDFSRAIPMQTQLMLIHPGRATRQPLVPIRESPAADMAKAQRGLSCQQWVNL
jgi:hypothetical protein